MAYIKKIKLPGIDEAYDIYDASAIHDLSDIEGLGLQGAFIYKGTVATVAELPAEGNKVGYVYHVTENGSEYVWVTENRWEEFGHHIVVDHKHDVSGNVSVTGTNEASAVEASGSISVPTVSKEAKYIKGNSASVINSVETIKAVKAITGFGAHETGSAISGLSTATVNSASATDVSIPNVSGNDDVTASKITGNEDVSASKITENADVTASKISANEEVKASKVDVVSGSAAAWNASVTDGLLEITWTANVPTGVTTTEVIASKVTADDVVASKVVASDVVASKVVANDVTASKVTLGAAIAASKVLTSEIVVATGASATISAITNLGEASTSDVVTDITTGNANVVSDIVAGAVGDIEVGNIVTIGSEDKTINVTGTAAAQAWTQTSGSFSAETGSAK